MNRDQRRRRRRGIKYEQHVRLHHWVLGTPAYRSLPPTARAVLVELMRVYNGTNNGRLGLSVRDAADLCLISKATAARSFLQLEDRGFIVMVKKGSFSVKFRLATEWALTEFHNDVTKETASKAFMRWRPKTQNTVSPEVATVSLEGPSADARMKIAASASPEGPSHDLTTDPRSHHEDAYTSAP